MAALSASVSAGPFPFSSLHTDLWSERGRGFAPAAFSSLLSYRNVTRLHLDVCNRIALTSTWSPAPASCTDSMQLRLA